MSANGILSAVGKWLLKQLGRLALLMAVIATISGFLRHSGAGLDAGPAFQAALIDLPATMIFWLGNVGNFLAPVFGEYAEEVGSWAGTTGENLGRNARGDSSAAGGAIIRGLLVMIGLHIAATTWMASKLTPNTERDWTMRPLIKFRADRHRVFHGMLAGGAVATGTITALTSGGLPALVTAALGLLLVTKLRGGLTAPIWAVEVLFLPWWRNRQRTQRPGSGQQTFVPLLRQVRATFNTVTSRMRTRVTPPTRNRQIQQRSPQRRLPPPVQRQRQPVRRQQHTSNPAPNSQPPLDPFTSPNYTGAQKFALAQHVLGLSASATMNEALLRYQHLVKAHNPAITRDAQRQAELTEKRRQIQLSWQYYKSRRGWP